MTSSFKRGLFLVVLLTAVLKKTGPAQATIYGKATFRWMGLLLVLLLLVLARGTAHAQPTPQDVIEHRQYVNDCKTALGLSATPIPAMDCNEGVRFAGGTGPGVLINDFLGYRKISDYVDLTFVCRWLSAGAIRTGPGPFLTAASVELLIHNRQNGNTCFFEAKPRNASDLNGVGVFLPPVTADDALTFWMSPREVNASESVPSGGGGNGATLKCVACHAAGAYIASPRIASSLALFGLLNNGHDMLNAKYKAVNGSVAGSAFQSWNAIKDGTLATSAGCASGCHVIAKIHPTMTTGCPPTLDKCPPPGIIGFGGQSLIPSIANDIDDVISSGVMGSSGPVVGGDYSSINLGTPPTFPQSGAESELYADARASSVPSVKRLLTGCGAPDSMEVHVVGSSHSFYVTAPGQFTSFPNRLSAFNAKDGLVCLNADQEPGKPCKNYSVRYECTSTSGAKTWTSYASADTPAGDGDHEPRPGNPCSSGTPTGIQAQYVEANGMTYSSFGPLDRLARLSQYGLTCYTADQPDGRCANYVVKYGGCKPVPIIQFKTLKSVFLSGKQLTAASNNLVKGQAHNDSWNTQLWIVEPIPDTEYVRLRNNGTLGYLTVSRSEESALVGTLPSLSSTPSQTWLIEPISESNDVRLKNMLSGKYLTIADPANVSSGEQDYLPVYSQSRNTSWTSQRWQLQ